MTQASEQSAAAATPGEVSRRSVSAPTGSLADRIVEPPTVSFRESFPPPTLLKMAVLAGLFVAAHFFQLQVLVRKWITDPFWTHGFVIPLFSIYLLYARREELMLARRRVGGWNYVGLALVVLGLVAQPLCVYPIRNHWLMWIAMVGVLFGLVLYLAGSSVIRITWLPILYLLFALPISPGLYTKVSVPMQNIAARGSVGVLRLAGVAINAVASRLEFTSRSGVVRDLTVAEACNGMRLLTAFLALGVAMAYLDDKPIWQRVVLVIMAVPIAIFCNILRVAITAWMFYIDKPELGQDFMHKFTGILMLVPAFLMLWALAWLLRHLFVEPAEPGEDSPAGEDAA